MNDYLNILNGFHNACLNSIDVCERTFLIVGGISFIFLFFFHCFQRKKPVILQ